MPSDAQIAEVDKAIVAGELEKARGLLTKLIKGKPEREARAKLARLARRAGLPEISVRLLSPIVRTEGRKIAEEATEIEKTEYGTALRLVGAVEESIALLETVHSKTHPESLFLLTLSYFARWDYDHAIPLLKEYIECPGLEAYQRLVGEANLASALIHERRLEEGEKVLNHIEREARAGDRRYLLGKTLYFGAELEVLRDKPAAALKKLKASREFLSGTAGIDTLLIEMWEAIAHHQQKRSDDTAHALDKIKEAANQQGYGELARNCDLHRAWFSQDPALYEYVYFGTPSEAFRKRMLQFWPEGIKHAKRYNWAICPGENPKLFSFEDQGKLIKVGTVLHRLFRAFHSDFYRPFRVAELHARIYPGEFFNPVSAAFKVRQAIKLLRARFKARHLSLAITEKDAAYRLSSTKPLIFTVGEDSPTTKTDEILRKVHEAFPGGFTAKEAAKHTDVPRRTLVRALEEAVRAGDLKRLGATSAISYQFVVHPTKR